ncbi:MAG: hypothetical protein JWO94_2158 [Verrucomicrobiaceae bacterium]|nr:hypothetical protein [Verrucomicrobiaceae bacterium]
MKIFLALLVLSFLPACGSVSYTDGKYAPTLPSSVEVVTLGQLQKPYEIIGEYTGNPVLQTMRDWKVKAAAMGANAITLPETKPNGYIKVYAIRWK